MLLQQGEMAADCIIEPLRRDIAKVVGSMPLHALLDQFLKERLHTSPSS